MADQSPSVTPQFEPPAGREDALVSAIGAEWHDRTVPAAVRIAADDIVGRYGDAALGVLFYGSCLRTGEYEDKILDFYVLVRDYRSAYGRGIRGALLAIGNAMVPPNVFYHEIDVEGVAVRSKYAVLSLADFERRVQPDCTNVSIWARFCQPCLLMRCVDTAIQKRVAAAAAQAVRTMLASAKPLLPKGSGGRALWIEAFSQTYRSELRSEPAGKGKEIYELDAARYDHLSAVLGQEAKVGLYGRLARIRSRFTWWRRRVNGKTVSLLRLIKASMTFSGGMDYLAWKISRHSGVTVVIKPWMRRIPIIAGLYLFISLRLKGAFR